MRYLHRCGQQLDDISPCSEGKKPHFHGTCVYCQMTVCSAVAEPGDIIKDPVHECWHHHCTNCNEPGHGHSLAHSHFHVILDHSKCEEIFPCPEDEFPMPPYDEQYRDRKDWDDFQIGTPITRQEALQKSREILENAEQGRLEAAEQEAVAAQAFDPVIYIYQFYVTTESQGTQYFFMSHSNKFSPEEINLLAKQILDEWKATTDQSDVLIGFLLDHFSALGFVPFTPETVCEITEKDSVVLSYGVSKPKQEFKQ